MPMPEEGGLMQYMRAVPAVVAHVVWGVGQALFQPLGPGALDDAADLESALTAAVRGEGGRAHVAAHEREPIMGGALRPLAHPTSAQEGGGTTLEFASARDALHTEIAAGDPLFGAAPQGTPWQLFRETCLGELQYLVRALRWGRASNAHVCHTLSPGMGVLHWAEHGSGCHAMLHRALRHEAELYFHLLALSAALVAGGLGAAWALRAGLRVACGTCAHGYRRGAPRRPPLHTLRNHKDESWWARVEDEGGAGSAHTAQHELARWVPVPSASSGTGAHVQHSPADSRRQAPVDGRTWRPDAAATEAPADAGAWPSSALATTAGNDASGLRTRGARAARVHASLRRAAKRSTGGHPALRARRSPATGSPTPLYTTSSSGGRGDLRRPLPPPAFLAPGPAQQPGWASSSVDSPEGGAWGHRGALSPPPVSRGLVHGAAHAHIPTHAHAWGLGPSMVPHTHVGMPDDHPFGNILRTGTESLDTDETSSSVAYEEAVRRMQPLLRAVQVAASASTSNDAES